MSEIRAADIEARLRDHCAPSALEGLDAHARSAAIRLPPLLRKSKQTAR